MDKKELLKESINIHNIAKKKRLISDISLINSTKHLRKNNTSPIQTFQKTEENISHLILEDILISKSNKDTTRKLQPSIHH